MLAIIFNDIALSRMLDAERPRVVCRQEFRCSVNGERDPPVRAILEQALIGAWALAVRRYTADRLAGGRKILAKRVHPIQILRF